MMTFEQIIIELYLPMYKRLYTNIKASTSSDSVKHELLYVASEIKAIDQYAGGVSIIECCNNVLRLNGSFKNKITRLQLDRLAFKLMYELRLQLKHFCIEYYPLKESQDLKLQKHYLWNVK